MTPEELRLAITKRRPQYTGRIRINRPSRDLPPNLRTVSVLGLCSISWADLDGDVNEEVDQMVLMIDDFIKHHPTESEAA